MIAFWGLYAVLIALLLGLAARCAESALRLYGRSLRWVWAGAIVGSVLLPFSALLWPGGVFTPGSRILEGLLGGGDGSAGSGLVAAPGNAEVVLPGFETWAERPGSIAMLDSALILLGAAATLIAVGLVVGAWFRLRARRRRWTFRRVDGTGLYLSRRTGPAVTGVLRPAIVLPRWVLSLEEEARLLVILHESEHLAAGDSRLLGLGLAAAALLPWNLPLWWQLRRLRVAVEMDCDRRVLARGAGQNPYGALLMRISGRRSPPAPAFAALVEPKSLLERRIRAMTSISPRFRLLRAAGSCVLAAGLVALACDAPVPSGQEDAETPLTEETASPEDNLPLAAGSEEPSFIPRDVDPQLENAEEVAEMLAEEYPSDLRDGGIGGRTDLWLFVDESGNVEQARIRDSSGHEALDEAGQRVAERMEFRPAMNQDEPVAVWVLQPITFRTSSAEAVDGDQAASGGSAALIFVDGEEISGDGLDGLDPDRIESIEVVKGNAATAIYGEAAVGGVITIRTRDGA